MSNPTPSPLDWVEPLLLGELDAEQAEALERWLEADDANRTAFLHEVQLCRGIRRAFLANDNSQALENAWEDELTLVGDDEDHDVMSSVIDQALAERRKHELEDEANRQLAAQQAEVARLRRFQTPQAQQGPKRSEWVVPLPVVIGAIAAMLFLAVYLLTPGTPTPSSTDGPGLTQTPTDTDRSRTTETPVAAPVAQLRQAHRPQWGGGDDAQQPASTGGMAPGRYALASGAVELRMHSGAVLLVEGPAEFELTDDHTGRLMAGRLTVDSTEAGGGFRLQTPTAEVVDRGGRFGLAVAPSGQTQAHVYAGRIDFSNLRPTAASGSLTLRPSQGAVIDRANAQPRREPVAPEQFALEMAALTGKPVVTGEADYHNQMPASVVMNRGPQSPRAWVALESTGRPLQRGTAWAQSYPSRPSMLIDTEGRVVDSYLVMFDPADETGRFKTAEFTLTFPGEVLTVITEDADLIASHGWYGDGQTQYTDRVLQVDGLEGEPGANPQPDFQPDSIEFSDDARTMRVFLGAHNGADVFRVLVVRPRQVGTRPTTVSPMAQIQHAAAGHASLPDCPHPSPDPGTRYPAADAAQISLKGEKYVS